MITRWQLFAIASIDDSNKPLAARVEKKPNQNRPKRATLASLSIHYAFVGPIAGMRSERLKFVMALEYPSELHAGRIFHFYLNEKMPARTWGIRMTCNDMKACLE